MTNTQEQFVRPEQKKYECVTLIGMPGSGKTTIGSKLAATLDMAFIDTDNLIESLYAVRLQDITDALSKDQFLDVEKEVICQLKAQKCVIATGGSVIYRPEAVSHLAKLGPLIYLQADLEDIEQRVAMNPERGVVILPNQTLADLYKEREPLYLQAADLICQTSRATPAECVTWIKDNLITQGLLCL